MIENQVVFEKKFEEYKIILIPKNNLITMTIENIKLNKYFQSQFSLDNLQKHKLLVSSFSIKEIIELISELMNKDLIKIEENQEYLKLILISPLPLHLNVDLILKRFSILNYKLVKQLIEENIFQREEIKSLKNKIKELNDQIKVLQKGNIIQKEEIESLNKSVKNKKDD
jgi:cell division protein FtsB